MVFVLRASLIPLRGLKSSGRGVNLDLDCNFLEDWKDVKDLLTLLIALLATCLRKPSLVNKGPND